MHVSIIGGNVAGLFTAIEIKKKYPNVNIVIYEKGIWNKPCGAAFSHDFYCELKKMDINIEAHPVDEFVFGSFSKALNKHPSPLLVGDRYDLQNELTNFVKYEINIPIVKTIVNKRFKYFAPTTIVASGFSGTTNDLLNRRNCKQNYAIIKRFEGHFNEPLPYPNKALIAFDHKYTGYGWLFAGNNKVNLGYGAVKLTKDQIEKRLKQFISVLNSVYECDLDPGIMDMKTGWNTWGLPMPVKKNYPVNHAQYHEESGQYINFIGVGDAIGMAHPILGAGIEPAWLSAKLLAKNLRANGTVNTKQYAKDIQKYSRQRITPGQDYWVCKFFRSKFYPFMPFKNRLINFMGGSHAHRIMTTFSEHPIYDYE